MSLAPSKSPRTPEPAYDLDYSVHDFEVSPHRDNQFLIRRTEDSLMREAAVAGARVLDVACGVAQLVDRLHTHSVTAIGLEPSREMAGVSRWLFPAERVVLVRGIAEILPFHDASFDRVICQGSLDHFVQPHAFMTEAARLLRPGGRVIVALANYESLSCRIGRLVRRARRSVPGAGEDESRRYWQPPPDHFHKGDLAFVHSLGGGALQLDRCYGVSLLWLVDGWGKQLDRLPERAAEALLRALDRIARRRPGLADMIVSVWRRPEPFDGAR